MRILQHETAITVKCRKFADDFEALGEEDIPIEIARRLSSLDWLVRGQ